MKNLIQKSMRTCYVFAMIITSILFNSCDNNDSTDCTGIDCLPPITQTGAVTFGCLINGEPFVDNSGSFNCFYQLVDGEYFFGIQAEDNVGEVAALALGSLKKEIIVGVNLPLNNRADNNFYALLDLVGLEGSTPSTNTNNDGSIIFIEFDTNSNVVSATFELTIIDPSSGTVYEITDGRFDAIFTQ